MLTDNLNGPGSALGTRDTSVNKRETSAFIESTYFFGGGGIWEEADKTISINNSNKYVVYWQVV